MGTGKASGVQPSGFKARVSDGVAVDKVCEILWASVPTSVRWAKE